MISLSEDSAEKPPIQMRAPILVRALAAALGVRPAIVVADLFAQGITTTLNGEIDPAAAAELCAEYGRTFELLSEQ